MSDSDLSPLEAFQNTFFYFVEELRVLASDAPRQRQSVGGPHVAWELQSDVRDHGEAVLRCAGSFLSEPERAGIASLLTNVGSLPTEGLRSGEDALEHPAWKGLRHEATHLLDLLRRPIAENLAFFNQGNPPAIP